MIDEPDSRDDPMDALERRLGYRFADRALLDQALTHRSFAHERGDGQQAHYERLEFLGDALLGFLVAEWLFRGDDLAREGRLSRRRQSLVRTEALARIAGELGLGEAIRLGRGEEQSGGRGKASLLADLFEAMLAAVYLDGGIRAARAFTRRHLKGAVAALGSESHPAEDFKTRLQETMQARLQRTPSYRIVSTSGPAHELQFEVVVEMDGDELGRGSGSNRKRAEQSAARMALEEIARAGDST